LVSLTRSLAHSLTHSLTRSLARCPIAPLAHFSPQGVAKTRYARGYSILSLICNVDKSSEILERVFRVLGRERVNIQMMSQGASKSNIALIIRDDQATHTLRALHHEFFE